MKKIVFRTIGLLGVVAFWSLSLPPTTLASTQPQCDLEVVVDNATSSVERTDTIFVRSGATIGFHWSSKNATGMMDPAKKSVPLEGSTTTSVSRSTKYTYTAIRSNSRSYCGVSVAVVSGYLTSPLSASGSRPMTLAGKVRGAVTSLVVSVTPLGTITATTSATVRVRNGGWSYPLPRVLPDGVYLIDMTATKSGVRTVVATSTITIGNPVPLAATTIVVVPIPLLTGGLVRGNGLVAVAYLQFINIGNATATVSGITMTQTGNAPAALITQLTAVADNGLARGVIGMPLTSTPFIGAVATVPISLTLAPKEMRVVTIKAALASNLLPYLGSKVTLITSSVHTNAKVQSTFPLFGTIWTLGY